MTALRALARQSAGSSPAAQRPPDRNRTDTSAAAPFRSPGSCRERERTDDVRASITLFSGYSIILLKRKSQQETPLGRFFVHCHRKSPPIRKNLVNNDGDSGIPGLVQDIVPACLRNGRQDNIVHILLYEVAYRQKLVFLPLLGIVEQQLKVVAHELSQHRGGPEQV